MNEFVECHKLAENPISGFRSCELDGSRQFRRPAHCMTCDEEFVERSGAFDSQDRGEIKRGDMRSDLVGVPFDPKFPRLDDRAPAKRPDLAQSRHPHDKAIWVPLQCENFWDAENMRDCRLPVHDCSAKTSSTRRGHARRNPTSI